MNLFWAFGRTPWTGDQHDIRPLPTEGNTTQKNIDTHVCMPRAGFEPTIPLFGRSKQYVPLESASTGTGLLTDEVTE
jgi:hypothetical protein